jgi:hypothetical protein
VCGGERERIKKQEYLKEQPREERKKKAKKKKQTQNTHSHILLHFELDDIFSSYLWRNERQLLLCFIQLVIESIVVL